MPRSSSALTTLVTSVLVHVACAGGSVSPAPTESSETRMPPLLDRAVFFPGNAVTEIRISPDGESLVSLERENGTTRLWLASVGEPWSARRRLTADTASPVAGFTWTPDSRFLVFVGGAGANGDAHIFMLEPAAASAGSIPSVRDLTPVANVQAQIYALPAEKPLVLIAGLNERDAASHDVYRIELETGRRTLLLENRANAATWVTDAAGVVRLGTRIDDRGAVEILRVDGDTLTNVYTCRLDERCQPLRFHADGERVYLITNRGTDVDLERLVLFNPMTREQELVDSDPERRVDFGEAIFSGEGSVLLATQYEGDRRRLYPKHSTFARDLERLRGRFPQSDLAFESLSANGDRAVVWVTSDRDPGTAYLYDRDTGEVEHLTRRHPDLPSAELASMQPVQYRARDGLAIPGYLTVPLGTRPRNLPAVVIPHPGPWDRVLWGYDPLVQFLANRGYVVFQPNYRGSRGFGKRFLRRGDGGWGTGAMQRDITDGVRYLVTRGIADPERVAIVGEGYGGFAALAGLAFTPRLFRAGVSLFGQSNVVTMFRSIPADASRASRNFAMRVGDPDDPTERLRLLDQSPLTAAQAIDAPMLVVHDVDQSPGSRTDMDRLVVTVRDRGRPVSYLRGSRDHVNGTGQQRVAIAAVLERFLGQHLGGRLQEALPESLAAHVERLQVDVERLEVTFGAGVNATPLPEPDAEVLGPETLYYHTIFDAMGQEIVQSVRRTLSVVSALDGDRWQVVDSTQMLLGAALDTVELHVETLLPIRRSVVARGADLHMLHVSDSVVGSIRLAGDTVAIAVALDASAFADGLGLDVAIAALPLRPGYQTPLRIFDVQLQRVRAMTLAVAGVETMRTVAGTFETYVVYVTPQDGVEAGTATLHVLRDAPHHVVRAHRRLPHAMGGGSAITELTAIGTRIRGR